jgi:hypothetical protein
MNGLADHEQALLDAGLCDGSPDLLAEAKATYDSHVRQSWGSRFATRTRVRLLRWLCRPVDPKGRREPRGSLAIRYRTPRATGASCSHVVRTVDRQIQRSHASVHRTTLAIQLQASLHDFEAQIGRARGLDTPGSSELDLLGSKVLERSYAVAQQGRDQVDLDLVQKSSSQVLTGRTRSRSAPSARTGHRVVSLEYRCPAAPFLNPRRSP